MIQIHHLLGIFYKLYCPSINHAKHVVSDGPYILEEIMSVKKHPKLDQWNSMRYVKSHVPGRAPRLTFFFSQKGVQSSIL